MTKGQGKKTKFHHSTPSAGLQPLRINCVEGRTMVERSCGPLTTLGMIKTWVMPSPPLVIPDWIGDPLRRAIYAILAVI